MDKCILFECHLNFAEELMNGMPVVTSSALTGNLTVNANVATEVADMAMWNAIQRNSEMISTSTKIAKSAISKMMC